MSEVRFETKNILMDDLFWQEDYEPITETDAELASFVEKADLPALLAALAAATVDDSTLTPNLRPPLTPVDTVGHPHGGMSASAQEQGRAVALAGLRRLRDEGINRVGILPDALVGSILDFLSDGHDEWTNMLKHELDLAGDKGGAPQWRYEDVAPDGHEFSVLIVGSGVAGIAAAHRFSQAGVPFTIIEASECLGGTWQKNRYPGVRLDTPTFGYSYSFAQRADWPHQFAEGHEVREYLETVASKAGIRERIEFGSRLVRANWDENRGTWETSILVRNGETQLRSFNAVISASGQLDIPNIPDFPGQDVFEGISMHSQEWDESVNWTGKKIAVIGTGASAYQIVPAIVDTVESMVVFQRSAPWMLPAPTYHERMNDTFDWLIRKVPHYAQWFRLWVTVLGISGRFHTVRAEDNWEMAPLSVSKKNHQVREELTRRLSEQFAGHPNLLKHAIPDYPPGSKRMLRDNGVWARALTAKQTTLEVSPIREFTPRGIVTQDGTEHDVDIVVYATGFKPSDYLEGIKITGREGVDLHDYWHGDARAYNGVTVPGFPNFFMVYGPNVGGVVAGSLHFMLERASEYALKAIHEVLKRRAKALDVKQVALDRFVDWVDTENRQMAWGQPYVRTWYQNSSGRVSQVWPFTNAEYWDVTERVSSGDYDFLM
ncbi:NAD(P)/FAD-dependent oxidoreductase [Paeniglutamicibacter sp. Y32M11]|uniref:flavin-containing monooxygenase n=1 Tax=Paeniglutamicibacter sp. Y32M11 TaxID=2853258 RepID=UPI001C527B3C|nr:NAD(P)/FAD-dependent oxidoreductase [Paeniglutamicibacter sp. Y32M11]QXQ10057.1 FAD-dependent oxidoreductase [Paeniglutamicibacter sp. Y32M11]